MEHPRLVEYARSQLAKGVSRADIEKHLRGQKWEEKVIAAVMAAADPTDSSPTSPPQVAAAPGRRPGKILPILLTLAIALAAWGAYQIYRSYSVAKLVREKTKFVEFSGRIAGQLTAETDPAEFGLLTFRGQLDSSQIDTPKAALQVTFDESTSLAGLSPQTDGHLLALTLLSVATGAHTIGGADVRFADWTTYLRPSRTPFAGDRNAAALAGLVNSLLGPNILTDFWVKIPALADETQAATGVLTTEHKATWALLFRPTGKIFGESKELRFTGTEPGGDIKGVPTEIHRYAIDGPWLTKQLVKTLRKAELENKMEVVAMLQNLVLGGETDKVTASLDSLEISDGELSVWVGRQDTLPYRMSLRLDAKEGTRSPLALRLSGEMDIDYTPPVAIEIPAQALDLKQLEEQLGLLQSLGNLFR